MESHDLMKPPQISLEKILALEPACLRMTVPEALAFDALVLSEMLGCDVSYGKIVHGDDHAQQMAEQTE
jgi:hypothetical protein